MDCFLSFLRNLKTGNLHISYLELCEITNTSKVIALHKIMQTILNFRDFLLYYKSLWVRMLVSFQARTLNVMNLLKSREKRKMVIY